MHAEAAILNVVRHVLPEAQVEVEAMPSGVRWLTCRLGQGWLVVEIMPDGRTGVSLVREPTEGLGGHDRAFRSADEAAGYVEDLLAALVRERVA